ncbi:SAM-dependent methyltransferase [Bosea sp. (in: a-proteobacteria)]|uniref:class I SAM-dependent methyltransferase n=1 Tax=Bosea sp. (in: a-proteobacteria) TaxID=1871050 RepID=UPI0026017135|nr:SAM-dependent methyltransferase [Bosea sp. (in: a-proteobacteria)]MCO5091116.1 SAM-dependent methyltransferase [Bosea sp. (in: a-proteobacteria)]
MTTLQAEIAELIRQEGPLPVGRYMALCLGHPRHGYYMTRDPFGSGGDFTTAPEISQMFGELIGLWVAHAWRASGAPARFRLVELGPGRGTLMADMLRATRIVPGFREALSVHLVETSPALRARQAATLQGVAPVWHKTLAEALDGPVIAVANEFLDALPLDQFVMTPEGWRERLVGLDAEGGLCWGLGACASPDAGEQGTVPIGTVFEAAHDALSVVTQLAGHVAREGGAALLIDYGSLRSGFGDTLQAMRRHGFADPLAEPGEADLTVHVDFERMGQAALKAGAALHGPATQRELLLALGLAERAQALSLKADAAQRAAISSAFDRLIAPGETGMGDLFKVLALSQRNLPLLPGFDLHRLPDRG